MENSGGAKMMSAYMIAQIRITDPDEYQNYLKGFMPIFERHGGVLLASSAKEIEVIEGDWGLDSVVLMQFPDKDTAQMWYNDPDYIELAEHRHASAQANIVLVEGIDT